MSTAPGKIRDWQTLQRNHWEWDWLSGCFDDSGLIMPTDIDGMVERKGHFLFIETKELGKDIPQGQGLALTRLVDSIGKRAVLFVLWGAKDDPKCAATYYCRRWLRYDDIDMHWVMDRFYAWYRWADNR